jgi:hypothetical protein
MGGVVSRPKPPAPAPAPVMQHQQKLKYHKQHLLISDRMARGKGRSSTILTGQKV